MNFKNEFFFVSKQVTTVTKVVREVSHMDPDPTAVSYVSMPLMSQDYQHSDPRYATDPYIVNFDQYDPYMGYPPQPGYPGPHGIYMPQSHHSPPQSPHTPSEHSRVSPAHGMFLLLFLFNDYFFILFFTLIIFNLLILTASKSFLRHN